MVCTKDVPRRRSMYRRSQFNRLWRSAAVVLVISIWLLPIRPAKADAYCKAGADLYGPQIDQNDTVANTGMVMCGADNINHGFISDNTGNSYAIEADSSAVASLASGVIKTASHTPVHQYGNGSFGLEGVPEAYALLSDSLVIQSTSGGAGLLLLQFDGVVGVGGEFNTRLIIDCNCAPGGGGTVDDDATFLDSSYLGGQSGVSASPGTTYDANKFQFEVPLSFDAGTSTPLFFELIADTSGNAAFDHTVGLALTLPDGTSFTSASGQFLSQPHDPITGGVTYQTSAVPEPAGWAMMILGAGLIGGMMRDRRKTNRASSALAAADL